MAARSSQDLACCWRATARARSKYASAFAASCSGEIRLISPAIRDMSASHHFFGHDPGVAGLINRSLALWSLGRPKAALEDADNAVKNAREIDQAATLMYALSNATWSQIYCGNYEAAKALVQELLPLAEEKDAAYWTAFGLINQGCLWAVTGSVANGVSTLSSGIAAWRASAVSNGLPITLLK